MYKLVSINLKLKWCETQSAPVQACVHRQFAYEWYTFFFRSVITAPGIQILPQARFVESFIPPPPNQRRFPRNEDQVTQESGLLLYVNGPGNQLRLTTTRFVGQTFARGRAGHFYGNAFNRRNFYLATPEILRRKK